MKLLYRTPSSGQFQAAFPESGLSPRKEGKKRGIGSNVPKEDSRRSKMSAVPARRAKGPEDGFGLSMAEIARHVGGTTSGIAKAVARLEGEG